MDIFSQPPPSEPATLSFRDIYNTTKSSYEHDLITLGITVELFLEYALGIGAEEIVHDHELKFNESHIERIMVVMQRLIAGEPLQYAAHRAFFYGHDFYVDENVLIPRYDTEFLVNEVIVMVKAFAATGIYDEIDLLEIGCGSGAPFVTILHELLFDEMGFELITGRGERIPGEEGLIRINALATDISDLALKIAKKNLRSLLPELTFYDNLFLRSDLFTSMPDSQWDVIFSNPPYISEREYEGLDAEVKKEPRSALVAGEDGLKVIRPIIEQGFHYLRSGGMMLLEIGPTQQVAVTDIARARGYKIIEVVSDLQALPRVVVLEKP